MKQSKLGELASKGKLRELASKGRLWEAELTKEPPPGIHVEHLYPEVAQSFQSFLRIWLNVYSFPVKLCYTVSVMYLLDTGDFYVYF